MFQKIRSVITELLKRLPTYHDCYNYQDLENFSIATPCFMDVRAKRNMYRGEPEARKECERLVPGRVRGTSTAGARYRATDARSMPETFLDAITDLYISMTSLWPSSSAFCCALLLERRVGTRFCHSASGAVGSITFT